MPTLAQHLQTTRQRICDSARSHGREAAGITLIAVSKTHPASAIRALAEAGQRCFGENYLQEARLKQAALSDLALEWHFIGPLQSNKTREVAAHFDWVHTVDRIKIARRLDAQRPDEQPPLNVCLQVNISHEPSKAGVTPAELPALAAAVAELPRLRLRGLMAIPAPADEIAAQREPFAQLRRALAELNSGGLALDTLSMGMSDDLDAAIAEGATMVRVGTAIFGPRPPQAGAAESTTRSSPVQ